MAFDAGLKQPLQRSGRRVGRVILPALAIGLAGVGISIWNDVQITRDLFLIMIVMTCALGLIVGAGRLLRPGAKLTRASRQGFALVARDPAPSFLSSAEGQIKLCNDAARTILNAAVGDTVAGAVRAYLANPGALILRLTTKAHTGRAAMEDVVTRQGHLRLMVQEVERDTFLWRIELFPQRDAGVEGASQISLPMLTVSKSGTVLFMNDALRRLVGRRVRSLDRLFTQTQLQSGHCYQLNGTDGPLDVMVIEGAEARGRRELFLAPVTSEAPLSGDAETMDALPIALVKLSSDGAVLSANAPARRFLDLQKGEDAQLGNLVEGLGRPISEWIAMLGEGRGLRRSEIVRAHRGEQKLFLQITPQRIKEDDRDLILAVLSDVTELKSREEQVVQSQKMQAIGQLAGGVAHDFNNLLTAITGHCDLLLLRHDPGDPDFSDLQQINQNANRAASLVGQLLAFSRKQNLRPERVDLREALADLTHLLNRLVGEKVELNLSHDPDLRPTRADKRQLEQVIMNLVVNARDALGENGGEVRIATSNVVFDSDVIRERATIPAGDYVMIRVSDNGCGIARDKKVKIFEPFFTTKKNREGTGLGLSTAYGIIKQTGGFIFVESVVGSGTEFTIYLPAASPGTLEPEAPPDKPSAFVGERDDGVILLVEDEAPVRAFASRALRLKGYTVLEAENAEQALAVLRDEALEVDLFLTDVIMPGLDGPSWVREALKARPDVHVVFVSGYAEESMAEDQSRIPNSVFLQKPFSLADLTATVQRQLH